jgi:hypothetical protein
MRGASIAGGIGADRIDTYFEGGGLEGPGNVIDAGEGGDVLILHDGDLASVGTGNDVIMVMTDARDDDPVTITDFDVQHDLIALNPLFASNAGLSPQVVAGASPGEVLIRYDGVTMVRLINEDATLERIAQTVTVANT